jgi:hypothetical protein
MTVASVRAGTVGRPAERRSLVEVGEVVVAEQPMSLVGQQPVDRAFPQPLAQDLPWVLEPLLRLRSAQRHARVCFRRARRWWMVDDYFSALLGEGALGGAEGQGEGDPVQLHRALAGVLEQRRGVVVDAVVVAAGLADDLATGLKLAAEAIDDGRAAGVLDRLVRVSNEQTAAATG